jgi:predicted ATPase
MGHFERRRGDMERRVAQKHCRKILITGTHSTGKTDLVARLVDRSPLNVVVVPEAARDCPFVLNRLQNYLSTTWLMATQVRSEIETQTRPDVDLVICDRGIPDILAYHEGAASCDELGQWLPVAINWISTYDRIFLAQADPDHAMAQDDLRLDDPLFRLTIAHAIEQWITRTNTPYELLPHDLAGRLTAIETDLTQAGWLR